MGGFQEDGTVHLQGLRGGLVNRSLHARFKGASAQPLFQLELSLAGLSYLARGKVRELFT